MTSHLRDHNLQDIPSSPSNLSSSKSPHVFLGLFLDLLSSADGLTSPVPSCFKCGGFNVREGCFGDFGTEAEIPSLSS